MSLQSMDGIPIRNLWTICSLIAVLGFLTKYFYRSYRHRSLDTIPWVPQQSWYRRGLLNEPKAPEVLAWAKSFPNDGLLRYRGVFNAERLLVTNPGGIADVMQNRHDDYEKSPAYRKILRMLLGDGLINAEGLAHKSQKTALAPSFTVRRVKAFYPKFWAKACQSVNQLERLSDGQSPFTVDMTETISAVMLDIIGSAGMGVELDVVGNPESEFAQKYRAGFAPSPQARQLHLLALLLPECVLDYIPSRRVREVHDSARSVRARCRNIIRERRLQLEKAPPDRDAADNVLSAVMSTSSLTDEELTDQAMTLFGAGHETTASALASAVYVLSSNPDGKRIQERLREEIRQNLPSPSLEHGSVTADQLDGLPYLRAVCSEVLRVFSPVPLIPRRSVVETVINGVRIPQGSQIRVAPWATNKAEALWGDDAADFLPERWLGQASGGAESNYAFLTFGAGRRTCIGSGFARGELAACVAAIFGRFEVDLVETGETEFGITVNFEGLWVKLGLIDGW